MDLGMYEKDLINIRLILEQTEQIDHQTIIEKYRNYSRKGAITCPFCGEKLKLRAGEIRDIHFSHPVGKTCMKAKAYDTYQRQTFRENEKHSVMKEIIYTELKGQERFKNDLKVEYGYLEKAEEKWNIYPDIYLKKGDREFALNIITNIQQIGDEKVVNNIHRRNSYFKNKGLEIIWFIEERELADDFVNRVLHLWEAESL